MAAVIRDERSGLGYGIGARDIESANNPQKHQARSKMMKHFHEVVDREAKRMKSV